MAIYLHYDQIALVQRLANEQDKSESEVVREMVESYAIQKGLKVSGTRHISTCA